MSLRNMLWFQIGFDLTCGIHKYFKFSCSFLQICNNKIFQAKEAERREVHYRERSKSIEEQRYRLYTAKRLLNVLLHLACCIAIQKYIVDHM
jgi:hypothetical protein